jgi:diguanylate cyclase (GGDEF)-like protein
MSVQPASASADFVSLSERVRFMRLFRVGAAAVAILAWFVLPDVHAVPALHIAGAAAAYLALSAAAEAAWRLASGRALVLFGAMLVVDGLFLAWVAYGVTGELNALRSLVYVHLVAVALLASFRTGLKLAMWHSLLALGVFHLLEAGLLRTGDGPVSLSGGEYRVLLAHVVGFWIIAVATAAFAAVNERELRRRRYDLEALRRFALRLEESSASDAVVRSLLAAVADDLGLERSVLFTVRDGRMTVAERHGVAGGSSAGADLALEGEDLPQVAARSTGPLLVRRPEPGSVVLDLLPGAENLVLVPLRAEGRPVGVLVCEHGLKRDSRIERRVISTLERYTSPTALALVNAWLLEHFERTAMTDGLTGVANRRAFDEALVREASRTRRTGDPASVVLFDLDHFKRLNDTHGHAAGDDTLRAVASAAADVVRPTDTLARYGGEEFVLILPGAGAQDARRTAERVRVAVRELGGPIPVTISVGVATYDAASGADLAALVGVADQALYAAKRAGRDQVMAAADIRPSA